MADNFLAQFFVFGMIGISLKRKSFKIAIVVDELIVGGVAICSVDLTRALARIGYDVTLIVLRKSDYEVEWQQNQSTIFLNTPITVKTLSELMQNFDTVLVGNGVAMPFAFEAARYAARPLIVEWLHGEVKARQFPVIDFTIAASETIYKGMGASGHDVFIPNGVDLSKFRPRQKECPERVRLIQIAREGKTMDADLAILGSELVRQGLPIEVDIVGKSGFSTDQLRFHGVQKDVTQFLGESDILLHMAQMESFGMPAIEAMASGAIPVVSDVGGLPWSVVDGETGFVVPFGDRAAASRILTELVWNIKEGHPDVYRIRQNALRRAKEEFDILRNARRIGEYLEEKSVQLPRKDRSAAYPFSFVGPVLSFVLRRTDQYLCAMADIVNAADLTEALAAWKAFRGSLGHEWNDVSAETWKPLDAAYSNLVRDTSESSDQREAICYFWLAFLALVVKRYDWLFEFLSRGNSRDDVSSQVLPRKILEIISFALAVSLAEILDIEASSTVIEAKEVIKRCYYRNDFDRLRSWKLSREMLSEVLRAVNLSDLLAALDAVEK